MKTWAQTALLLGGMMWTLFCGAAEPLLGVDYYELPTPAIAARGKIPVVEYFWYRCPHCYALEPTLESWAAKLPPNVELEREPAVLSKGWLLDARVFYALRALGAANLHKDYLYAVHREGGRRLDRDAYVQWAENWFAAHGIDRRRFDDAFHSEPVIRQAEQAYADSRRLQLGGTPTFIVAGRYVVSPSIGEDERNVLSIIDYLLVRIEKQAQR